jgi:predicted transcriptional regulator
MINIFDESKTFVLFDDLCDQINTCRQSDGFSQADILTMADPLATILNQLVRRGEITAAQFGDCLNLTEAQCAHLINLLVQQGLVITEQNPNFNQTIYKPHLAPKRQRKAQTNIWNTLDL